MASFPGSVPSLPRPGSTTAMNASGYEGDAVIDAISDEVEAIATELGTDPSGPFSTVKARFDETYSPWHLPMVASVYFATGMNFTTEATIAGYERPSLFIPMRSCTLDRIGVYVTSPGAAGSVIRLGIRAWDTATALPGALILDAGTVAATTTGAKEATISQAVTAGTPYVLIAVGQGAPATEPSMVAHGGRALPFADTGPSANAAPAIIGYSLGALPSTAPTWFYSSAATPRVWVRTSA